MSNLIIAPFPYQYGHDQGCDAGIDVYHGSTGKVDGTHLLEKTSSPYPVGHRYVHQDAPKHCKHQETGKLDPFRKSSQNQGGSNDGKHTLEEYEHQFRNPACSQAGSSDSLQEELVETTDEMSPDAVSLHQAAAKYETVAERYPEYADCSYDEQTLHDDAQDIFLSDQSAIEQGNARNSHQ